MILYINNLAAGQTWSVYTLSGMLVYQGMAGNKEVKVNLSARGVYIIKAGVTTGKVLY
ncbi:T9SS type A sorting domain-containing protein [Parabacteroides sp. OttesenSCG-928-B22]|nr:T9SS type A sorting domain-containing protein [Parabacteroides sp. OttesenSCG-928-B22]